MAYSGLGLTSLMDGVTPVGTHLAACTGDPGTTGANIDAAVTPLASGWGTPSGDATGAQVVSTEVAWDIPSGGGAREYTHFAVLDGADPATAGFVTGGPLDPAQPFADNGGTLLFTGTLTTQSV